MQNDNSLKFYTKENTLEKTQIYPETIAEYVTLKNGNNAEKQFDILKQSIDFLYEILGKKNKDKEDIDKEDVDKEDVDKEDIDKEDIDTLKILCYKKITKFSKNIEWGKETRILELNGLSVYINDGGFISTTMPTVGDNGFETNVGSTASHYLSESNSVLYSYSKYSCTVYAFEKIKKDHPHAFYYTKQSCSLITDYEKGDFVKTIYINKKDKDKYIQYGEAYGYDDKNAYGYYENYYCKIGDKNIIQDDEAK